jgi:dynein heavy chain
MKFQGTPLEKYQQLVKQCKKNMHLVVCMSPIGGQFRKRLRLFPSLVNCTSIDWFASWSEEALTETAISVLTGKMESIRAVVDCCVKMHQDVIGLTTKYRIEHRKYCYVTPTNYL